MFYVLISSELPILRTKHLTVELLCHVVVGSMVERGESREVLTQFIGHLPITFGAASKDTIANCSASGAPMGLYAAIRQAFYDAHLHEIEFYNLLKVGCRQRNRDKRWQQPLFLLG
jgi:hypothetical protein